MPERMKECKECFSSYQFLYYLYFLIFFFFFFFFFFTVLSCRIAYHEMRRIARDRGNLMHYRCDVIINRGL